MASYGHQITAPILLKGPDGLDGAGGLSFRTASQECAYYVRERRGSVKLVQSALQ